MFLIFFFLKYFFYNIVQVRALDCIGYVIIFFLNSPSNQDRAQKSNKTFRKIVIKPNLINIFFVKR